MKYKFTIWFLFIWSGNLLAQSNFTVKEPFDNLYFIENKGQFDQKYNPNRPLNSPAAVLWTGETNVYLHQNGSGFVWETTLFKPEFEQQAPRKSEQESEHQEKEERSKPVSEQIQFQLIGTNPNANMIIEQPSNHYWTFGPKHWNSYGYKKITFQNIYPNIDIVYQVGNGKSNAGLIKYSFILHNGANVKDIQFRYVTPNSYKPLNTSLKNNKLLIQNQWLIIEELGISVTETNFDNISQSLKSPLFIQYAHNKARSTWGFNIRKGDQVISKIKNITIIDPYVRLIDTLKEAKTIFTRWGDLSNMVSMVDYDNDQHAYVLSACLLYPQVAKYDSQGKLIWIFSGQLPAINWYSSYYAGPSTASLLLNNYNKCLFVATSIDNIKSPRIIELNSEGNYIQKGDSILPFVEIWDMEILCDKRQIISASGGIYNMQNLINTEFYSSPPNSNSHIITGDSISFAQDGVIIRKNLYGHLFTIISYNKRILFWDSFNGNWKYKSVENRVDFLHPELNFKKNIYSVNLYPFIQFEEFSNYPNLPVNNQISNHNNCLAVNSKYAFVYDGKVFLAIDIFDGKILAIDSVPYHNGVRGHIGQSGIAVDDCNRVFIGGDSAQVLVYSFTGSKFLYDTTFKLIPSTPRATIDVRLDRNSGTIFVTGDSFLASFKSPFNCNLSLFKIDTFLINGCQGDYAAAASLFDTSDGPEFGVGPWQSGYANLLDSNSQVTFEWKLRNNNRDTILRLINLKVGQIDTLKNPGLTDTIELTISYQYDCNGPYQKRLFIPRLKDTTWVDLTFCQGDSFFLSSSAGSGSGSDSTRGAFFTSDTSFSRHLINIQGCDSLINYKLIFNPIKRDTQYLVGCSNDTFILPNATNPRKIITSTGWFADTLKQSNGCESIWVYRADFGNDTNYALNYWFCFGDTAKFSGKSYTNNNIHIDSFKALWGCDSIVQRNIQFYPKIDTTISLTLCPKEVFWYKNQSYIPPTSIFDTLTSIGGCDSTVSIHLTKSPLLGSFELDTTNNPNFSFVQKSTGNMGFIWRFGDGNVDSVNFNTQHLYDNQQDRKIQICLEVWDSSGCRDTICEFINIYKLAFWVYNVFTPNNDNINDVHRIGFRNESLLHDVYIYNRWGALVYKTEKAKISDPLSYWNGKEMNIGDDCPSGSYFAIYRFYTNGQLSTPVTIEGSVQLIR